jgi:hypothetical protein
MNYGLSEADPSSRAPDVQLIEDRAVGQASEGSGDRHRNLLARRALAGRSTRCSQDRRMLSGPARLF